ncbi:PUM1, partial [Symbiodinium sp. KB8]
MNCQDLADRSVKALGEGELKILPEFHHQTTRIQALARDQEGCRFLQAKLETADTAERREVFDALLPKMGMLVGDSSGSAVVQKLLDICTPDQRRAIVEKFRHSVVQLSLEMHGSLVIQKAFQVCPPEIQSMLAGELRHGVIDCIKSMHGNHVVQTCIEQMPPESAFFVVEAVEDKAETMASNIYGHGTPKHLEKMLQQILQSVTKLSTDPYGNSVICHILEHGNPEHKRIIVNEVCDHVLQLGKDEHASKVVEKCFQASTTGEHAALLKEERQRLMHAVRGPAPQDPSHRTQAAIPSPFE